MYSAKHLHFYISQLKPLQKTFSSKVYLLAIKKFCGENTPVQWSEVGQQSRPDLELVTRGSDEQSLPHHMFSIYINTCRPLKHAGPTHFPFPQNRGSEARRTLKIAESPRFQSPHHRVWTFKTWMSLVGSRELLQPRRMCVFSVSTQSTADKELCRALRQCYDLRPEKTPEEDHRKSKKQALRSVFRRVRRLSGRRTLDLETILLKFNVSDSQGRQLFVLSRSRSCPRSCIQR